MTMMTRDLVEKRKEELLQFRDQMIANMNAANGGIETCDWMLEVMDNEEREATSQKEKTEGPE